MDLQYLKLYAFEYIAILIDIASYRAIELKKESALNLLKHFRNYSVRRHVHEQTYLTILAQKLQFMCYYRLFRTFMTTNAWKLSAPTRQACYKLHPPYAYPST